MSTDLTVKELEQALPKSFKNQATPELVDTINNLTSDDTLKEAYRDNIIGYASILKDGKFRLDHYINAVKYVTHKLMGSSNIAAYTKTFPERYKDFKSRGVSDKDIASYVSSYNKNKLVNIIREQTLIPTHIINQDYYQEAINKQVNLMRNIDGNVSPTVQQKAADSLIINLKPPETAKVEIDVRNKADEVTQNLHDTIVQLAAKQREMIEQGVSRPIEIAESKINVIEEDSSE